MPQIPPAPVTYRLTQAEVDKVLHPRPQSLSLARLPNVERMCPWDPLGRQERNIYCRILLLEPAGGACW